MFLGYYDLDATVKWLYQAKNGSGEPAAATGAPTFRIYGESGLVGSSTGSLTAFDTGNVTGTYEGSQVVSAANGYERGKCYTIRVLATVGGLTRAEMYTFMVQ